MNKHQGQLFNKHLQFMCKLPRRRANSLPNDQVFLYENIDVASCLPQGRYK